MRGLWVLVGVAVAHLRVRARQTFVTTLGVAVGVGFFLAVSGMMVGSQDDFMRAMIDNAPHVIVRDEQRGVARQPATDAFPGAAVEIRGVRPEDEVRGLKDWPAMLADARATPGTVATAALSGGVALRFAGRSAALNLNGIDPRTEGRLTRIEDTLIGGRLIDLEDRPDGIILSRPIADRLSARLGDTLVVSASSGSPQRMRIVALIDPQARTGFYGGDANAYALLRTTQILFGRPNIVNQLHVRLANPQTAEAHAAAWEGRWGYTWESWQERSREVMNLLAVRSIIMYAVIGAILLLASFGIYTGVSNSVNDKRRDIAILRAMGFRSSDVEAIFLVEGLVVGGLGVLAGFAIGALLLEALAHAPLTLQGKPLSLPLDRSLRQYVIVGGASLASALIAAWLPARKAAAVDPVDILRGAS